LKNIVVKGEHIEHLQLGNWQKNSTFVVAKLPPHLEVEPVSIKSMVQRKNGSEV
jgi:hypothetical protein